MQSAWPWLAIAAAGALHGMNPAAGWAIAAWSARSAAKLQVLRMLLPIAAGHVAAILVVAAAVPLALQFGWRLDTRVAQGVAAVLLLTLALRHWRHRGHRGAVASASGVGIALWSFIVGTLHGAGWMLVPALLPICADGRMAASAPVLVALAAVGVHTAAMLATTLAMAVGAQRGWRAIRQRHAAAGLREDPVPKS